MPRAMENNPELSELVDSKLALQKQEMEIDYLRRELEAMRKLEALHRQTEAQKAMRLHGIISRIALAVETELEDGRACPFCRRTGMYVDGEYWHGSGCVYDEAMSSYKSQCCITPAGGDAGESGSNEVAESEGVA